MTSKFVFFLCVCKTSINVVLGVNWNCLEFNWKASSNSLPNYSKSLQFLWLNRLNEKKKLSSKMTNSVKSATCVPHFHFINVSLTFSPALRKRVRSERTATFFQKGKTFCGWSVFWFWELSKFSFLSDDRMFQQELVWEWNRYQFTQIVWYRCINVCRFLLLNDAGLSQCQKALLKCVALAFGSFQVHSPNRNCRDLSDFFLNLVCV